jgi:hypothetical protein
MGRQRAWNCRRVSRIWFTSNLLPQPTADFQSHLGLGFVTGAIMADLTASLESRAAEWAL